MKFAGWDMIIFEGRSPTPVYRSTGASIPCGLVSSSFGRWWGADAKDGVEFVDDENHRYLVLRFQDDVLVGATSIGLTQHVGVLQGLIQNKTPLGKWKQVLTLRIWFIEGDTATQAELIRRFDLAMRRGGG